MEHVAPGDVDGLARAHECEHVVDVVPDHRHELPGAVAERQPQELAAVAARAALDLPHEQHLVEVGPVDALPDQHGITVERTADG